MTIWPRAASLPSQFSSLSSRNLSSWPVVVTSTIEAEWQGAGGLPEAGARLGWTLRFRRGGFGRRLALESRPGASQELPTVLQNGLADCARKSRWCSGDRSGSSGTSRGRAIAAVRRGERRSAHRWADQVAFRSADHGSTFWIRIDSPSSKPSSQTVKIGVGGRSVGRNNGGQSRRTSRLRVGIRHSSAGGPTVPLSARRTSSSVSSRVPSSACHVLERVCEPSSTETTIDTPTTSTPEARPPATAGSGCAAWKIEWGRLVAGKSVARNLFPNLRPARPMPGPTRFPPATVAARRDLRQHSIQNAAILRNASAEYISTGGAASSWCWFIISRGVLPPKGGKPHKRKKKTHPRL